MEFITRLCYRIISSSEIRLDMLSATHKMGFVDIVFQLDCQSIHSIFLKLFVHGLPTMNKQHRPFSQRAKL